MSATCSVTPDVPAIVYQYGEAAGLTLRFKPHENLIESCCPYYYSAGKMPSANERQRRKAIHLPLVRCGWVGSLSDEKLFLRFVEALMEFEVIE